MSALDLLFALLGIAALAGTRRTLPLPQALLGIAALAGAGAFVSFLLLVERAGRAWRIRLPW